MEEADATSGRVSRLAFYAGSLVAAASKNLHLWDANTYKQIKSQPAHDNLIISMTL
jgi:WD40 repeat protein